jgi:hypothetical protein
MNERKEERKKQTNKTNNIANIRLDPRGDSSRRRKTSDTE